MLYRNKKENFWVQLSILFVAYLVLLFHGTEAYAAEDITSVIFKTAKLLKYISLILGPGLGAIFGLSGMMKIRRKDEDPREFSKGIMYIISGVGCAMVGMIIYWILNYYDTTSASQFKSLD